MKPRSVLILIGAFILAGAAAVGLNARHRSTVSQKSAPIQSMSYGVLLGQDSRPDQPIDPLIAPITRENNCTIAGCHAQEQAADFVHGPVAVGACNMCHAYEEPAEHTFKYVREGAEMCSFCHIGRLVGETVHRPVMEGKCLDCHDPHGSAVRKLVRAPSVGELCLDCHADVREGVAHLHTPVAENLCADCHESHASEHPRLLVSTGTELCLMCHEGVAHDLESQAYVHEPVRDGCHDCHDAHGTEHISQLRQSPAELCSSCHVEIAEKASQATVVHSVVLQDDRACLNCHTAHAAEPGSALMRARPIQVCLDCHAEPIEMNESRVVVGMAELAEPDMFLHGPLREGECQGCHEPHGSSYPFLLPQKYSPAFYQKFDMDRYALCFECHDSQLVLDAATTATTNFRNGEVNLHYLHVNKTGEPGRNCRACHMTHSSAKKLHIRESVPYGGWDLPINFEVTQTGGSCAAGCHRAMSYDRESPVDNSPVEPEPDQGGGAAGAGGSTQGSGG